MKKETELTFTRTGEKWQRTGSEGTRWQEGSEGSESRREAGSGGNRRQQAVSEITRVGSSLGTTAKEGWVVASRARRFFTGGSGRGEVREKYAW